MAQILVRDLDPQVIESLRAQAKEHGRSLESEVRQILAEAARQTAWKDAWAQAEAIRSRFAGRLFSGSAELIREDRDH